MLPAEHPVARALAELTQQGQLLLLPGFLQPELCQNLLTQLRTCPLAPAETDYANKGAEPRRTSLLDVPLSLEQDLMARLSAVSALLSQHFKRPLTRHERPQFLKYQPGDFFKLHRDRTEAPIYAERSLSLILLLNDHSSEAAFEGGRLSFFRPHPQDPARLQGIPLPPEQGMLIAFDPDLLHEVSALSSGERYSVVTWLAA
jgi:predicted 2-oxoglutarate/Fe(II)-dependent dioxygenase YbiX